MYMPVKKCRDHHVRSDCDQRTRQPLQENGILATSCRGALGGSHSQTDERHEQHWPHDQESQVFDDPPGEAAGLIDPPQEVETVFDLFDRAQQRPGEQCKAHQPTMPLLTRSANCMTRPVSWVAACSPTGRKKLVDDGLQVAVRAEYFQGWRN